MNVTLDLMRVHNHRIRMSIYVITSFTEHNKVTVMSNALVVLELYKRKEGFVSFQRNSLFLT
jgi:hypothetical protein